MKLHSIEARSMPFDPDTTHGDPTRDPAHPLRGQDVEVRMRLHLASGEQLTLEEGMQPEAWLLSLAQRLIPASTSPVELIGSSSPSSSPQAVFSVRALLDGAPTFSQAVRDRERTTMNVQCLVTDPGTGRVIEVVMPIEVSVSVSHARHPDPESEEATDRDGERGDQWDGEDE